MAGDTAFAAQMRERYPEGLTGVFAVGGTRMTYIFDTGREKREPGEIGDYAPYLDNMLNRVFGLSRMFFDLGGQNMVIPVMSYQIFSNERGQAYSDTMAQFCRLLVEQKSIDFYHELEIDPYFVGIDTLLQFPEQALTCQLAQAYEDFSQNWTYQEGRHKIIWEIAPIPLFSIWRAHEVMGEAAQAELETALAAADNLTEMHDLLYQYYARAVYGTDLPMPHFYLGTNRNGDLKMRAMLPISLLCGGPFRMFFTPYPSLLITRER